MQKAKTQEEVPKENVVTVYIKNLRARDKEARFLNVQNWTDVSEAVRQNRKLFLPKQFSDVFWLCCHARLRRRRPHGAQMWTGTCVTGSFS